MHHIECEPRMATFESSIRESSSNFWLICRTFLFHLLPSSSSVPPFLLPLPTLQINTNGIMSFREPFYSPFPQVFPGTSSSISNAYLIAPFWEDVDIRNAGDIYYETHDVNNSRSSELLAQVSGFVSNQTGTSFSGTWMAVAFWDQVHPYPHGLPPAFLQFLIGIYPDLYQVS